ncbi:hypothetical protein GCM10017750_30190 [Streptomyces racemochromogenes]
MASRVGEAATGARRPGGPPLPARERAQHVRGGERGLRPHGSRAERRDQYAPEPAGAAAGMVVPLVVPTGLNAFGTSCGRAGAQVLMSGIRGSAGLLSRDSDCSHDPGTESET